MQKITREMTDSIWNTFRKEIEHGNCFGKKQGMLIKELSANENSSTGISENSARIYFMILFNLVSGQQNKRIIKINDMRKYCSLICSEWPEYKDSVIQSLQDSNVYWKTINCGNFVSKIDQLIEELKRK